MPRLTSRLKLPNRGVSDSTNGTSIALRATSSLDEKPPRLKTEDLLGATVSKRDGSATGGA
mgnify:CR=1 FL=1